MSFPGTSCNFFYLLEIHRMPLFITEINIALSVQHVRALNYDVLEYSKAVTFKYSKKKINRYSEYKYDVANISKKRSLVG